MVWYEYNTHLQIYIPRKLKEDIEALAEKERRPEERRSVSKVAVELLELGLAQKNNPAQPVGA